MSHALILIIAFVFLALLMISFFSSRYIKCPPDKAMVIFGKVAGENKGKHGFHILAGGGEFV